MLIIVSRKMSYRFKSKQIINRNIVCSVFVVSHTSRSNLLIVYIILSGHLQFTFMVRFFISNILSTTISMLIFHPTQTEHYTTVENYCWWFKLTGIFSPFSNFSENRIEAFYVCARCADTEINYKFYYQN